MVKHIDPTTATAELQHRSPPDIVAWAIDVAEGGAIVSTNFRPQEAVILHLCTRVQPDIPVLWVDHGYNTPATYRHAEDLIARLGLNVKVYTPAMTPARWAALHGGVPSLEDEALHAEFTRLVKLEPFRRGLEELQPTVWLTALRREQTAFRAGMDMVSRDASGVLKVCPVLEWTTADMDAYLRQHDLPSEDDYHDPTKVHDKRECGLHPDFFTR